MRLDDISVNLICHGAGGGNAQSNNVRAPAPSNNAPSNNVGHRRSGANALTNPPASPR